MQAASRFIAGRPPFTSPNISDLSPIGNGGLHRRPTALHLARRRLHLRRLRHRCPLLHQPPPMAPPPPPPPGRHPLPGGPHSHLLRIGVPSAPHFLRGLFELHPRLVRRMRVSFAVRDEDRDLHRSPAASDECFPCYRRL